MRGTEPEPLLDRVAPHERWDGQRKRYPEAIPEHLDAVTRVAIVLAVVVVTRWRRRMGMTYGRRSLRARRRWLAAVLMVFVTVRVWT